MTTLEGSMTNHARIMVVDDSPLNVDIVSRILLGEEPYDVETATSGEECLAKRADFQPQLVLLDITMPGLDGYTTCRRLKADTNASPCQVVLVSGKASTEERLEGYDNGADDYIVKPFNHDELLAKARVHVRLWNTQQELTSANEQLELYNSELERLVSARTKQVTQTQDLAVFALAQLADSRDPDTGEHLRRMRRYSQILGEQLSLHGPYTSQIDAAFLDDLYRASPLHDIGKVGVPDAILSKPGKLTTAEFDAMKTHVVIGAQTLEHAQHQGGEGGTFLQMAVDVARYHHERFDGSGYCAGLKGEEIPLAARIVALADVFDAVTSARVYKPPMDPTAARQIILDESGSHFDPAVVAAFEARFDDFLATMGTFPDDPSEGDRASSESAEHGLELQLAEA